MSQQTIIDPDQLAALHHKKYGGRSVIVPAVLSALLAVVIGILINYATGPVFLILAWAGLGGAAVFITFLTIRQVILQEKTEHTIRMMQQEAVFQSSLVTLLLCNPKGNLQRHASAILQKRLLHSRPSTTDPGG